jgi:hypothetical protein
MPSTRCIRQADTVYELTYGKPRKRDPPGPLQASLREEGHNPLHPRCLPSTDKPHRGLLGSLLHSVASVEQGYKLRLFDPRAVLHPDGGEEHENSAKSGPPARMPSKPQGRSASADFCVQNRSAASYEQVRSPWSSPGSSLAGLATCEPGSRDRLEDHSSNRSGGASGVSGLVAGPSCMPCGHRIIE